jgi:hypothetical protein
MNFDHVNPSTQQAKLQLLWEMISRSYYGNIYPKQGETKPPQRGKKVAATQTGCGMPQ